MYENCKFANQESIKTANLQTRKGENCKFENQKR